MQFRNILGVAVDVASGVEGVARRDFSVRIKEKMLLAGFVVLMTLMATVIYNDLARIIGR